MPRAEIEQDLKGAKKKSLTCSFFPLFPNVINCHCLVNAPLDNRQANSPPEITLAVLPTHAAGLNPWSTDYLSISLPSQPDSYWARQ